MLIKRYFFAVFAALPLFAGLQNLSLSQALEMVKHDNLEVKISHFEEQMKAYEADAAKGMNYGKLDLTINALRSNNALNVFGFKLQSREASFGDFGFSDFLGGIGGMMQQAGGDFGAFSQMMTNPATQAQMLAVEPADLNFPDAANLFQTKVTYKIPLYTGGKVTEYGNITQALYRMSIMDSKKVINAKVFQVKKAFYDISLVDNYIHNLKMIIRNVDTLEQVVSSMRKEGYAQDIDVLEVQARKAEADSLYNQAKLNRELAYQFLSFLLNQDVSSIKSVQEMAVMPEARLFDIYRDNIDIQKAELGLQISQMAVRAEQASYLPTVGGFGEYGSSDNKFLNDFKAKDSYTVGVQVNFNLFNGGIDKANVEKAKVKNLQVQEQVALAKKGIALKVKQLKTEILSLDSDIRSFQTQFNFARKVYASYQARYQEGIASISDVLIKQSKELEVLLQLQTVKNKRNAKVFELNSILNPGDYL
ncbi:MAG TPA: TolC family protein [Epsilonproteobacteria bacterium]|nr:TolC family protein [Campylobacterota bacterium]